MNTTATRSTCFSTCIMTLDICMHAHTLTYMLSHIQRNMHIHEEICVSERAFHVYMGLSIYI